jgi:hypothetical protein
MNTSSIRLRQYKNQMTNNQQPTTNYCPARIWGNKEINKTPRITGIEGPDNP